MVMMICNDSDDGDDGNDNDDDGDDNDNGYDDDDNGHKHMTLAAGCLCQRKYGLQANRTPTKLTV